MSLVFVCGHNGPCSPYCICKHVQGSMCMHGMGACPCMWGYILFYMWEHVLVFVDVSLYVYVGMSLYVWSY